MAEDGHVVGVAAEGCNILMYPFQCHQLIQESQILRIRIVLAVRQVGQMEEAKNAKPVSNGHNDDVGILFDEIVALMHRVDSSAQRKGSAVNPDHDRFLPYRLISLPYVQIQTVFPLIVDGSWFVRVIRLAGTLGIVISFVHTVVGGILHRCFPTMYSDRLLAYEGNTLEGNDIVRLTAYEGAVDTLHGQRMVVIAVGDLFVLAILGSQFFFQRRLRWSRVIFVRKRCEYTCATDKDSGEHPCIHSFHTCSN